MPVLQYENLTHAELTGLSRERTVVFLNVSPLEQHGPHLPLGVDAFSAVYFSEQIASKLSEKRHDWNFLILPPIYAGSDTLTYPGTIEIKPSILRAYLYEHCKQLAKDGFRNIIAVSGHGGPRHMVVLEELAEKMRWRHKTRMISASSRILFQVLEGGFVDKIATYLEKEGQSLSDEERQALKRDYHGGFLETSLMMVAKPDLVKPLYKELRPAIVDSVWKLRRDSGKKVGEGLGYLGFPGFARPEIGKALAHMVTEESLPMIERFLAGENMSKHFRSKFYFIPFMRTDFKLMILIALYMTAFGVAWWLLIHFTGAYK